MDSMKILVQVASVLVIVGAVNWLLVGSLNVNLVQQLFAKKEDKDLQKDVKLGVLERLVYILVGLSAVLLIYNKYGAAQKSM